MDQICRIGYARFETPDLGRQEDYYTNVLGLRAVAREADRVYLACPLDHCSVVLQRGAAASCVELGFHLPAGADLAMYARQLADHGVCAERQGDPAPGIASRLLFRDPKGTKVAVFNEPAQQVSESPWNGVGPTTLGHVAFNVLDVAKVVDFYCEVLKFKFSDSIEDFFVFLRCNANHHTVNFVRGWRSKMHHVAFEVRDWAHIQVACDSLSKNGYPIIWGPGRHGCGHNIFAYHRDPEGNIVELFAELDQMREELGHYEPKLWHRDRPQVPKVWPADPRASNLWGPMPPDGFLD
jgi:catechol-2,3-dioxygenase